MLSIWEYFWDEAEWTGGTPPSPTPAPTSAPVDRGAGGGHEEYIPASEAYWMAREDFLSYLNPKPTLAPPPQTAPARPAPSPAPPPLGLRLDMLPRLVAERKAAVALTHAATEVKALRSNFARLKELDRNIQTLRELELQRERRKKIFRLRKGLLKISRLVLDALLRKQLVSELRKALTRR